MQSGNRGLKARASSSLAKTLFLLTYSSWTCFPVVVWQLINRETKVQLEMRCEKAAFKWDFIEAPKTKLSVACVIVSVSLITQRIMSSWWRTSCETGDCMRRKTTKKSSRSVPVVYPLVSTQLLGKRKCKLYNKKREKQF